MIGTSQTEICNLALDHIAQRPITIITDPLSTQAIVCNRKWNIALKETLRAADWGFARVTVALAESGTFDPAANGYRYAYVMPVECAALRIIFNAYTTDMEKGEKYERAYDPTNNEELILTDVEDAYAKYTYIVTDVTLFDPSFVTSFGYRLAAEIAVPLIGKEDTAADMIKLFTSSLSDAARIGSYEGEQKTVSPNLFVDSRG